MSSQDYLALRTVCLKVPSEWRTEQANLSFIFFKSGVGRYVSGPNTKRLSSGDVLIINNTFKGALGSDNGSDISFKYFSACFEHLFPIFFNKEISILEKVADGYKSPKHYPAASDLARRSHMLLGDIVPEYTLEHRSQLLRIVAVLLNNEFKNAHMERAGSAPLEPHMIQVFDRLSVSELLDLPVDELAAKFNCSRRHLSRLFHQHFGLSVAALRMEMRLLKAISLLRNPDAKIINVAEQCGFNHLGLFNTCFKRRFGSSPGQWRKTVTEKDAAAQQAPANGPTACGLHITGLCPWVSQNANSITEISTSLMNPTRRGPQPNQNNI